MKISWETEMPWAEVAERSAGRCVPCRDAWNDIKMPCKQHATPDEEAERERRIEHVLGVLFGTE